MGSGRSRSRGGRGALRPLLVSALIAAGPAAAAPTAQPPPSAGGSPPAPTAGAPTIDGAGAAPDPEASSDELEAQVRAAFEAGDYASALPLLERAYAQTGTPKLLFNLGAVHHHLGNCEAARDFYREFMRRDPPDPGRTEAESALRSLAPYCGEARARPEPGRAAAPTVAARRAPTPAPGWERAAPTEPAARGVEARDVAIGSLLGAGAAAGVGAWLTWRGSEDAASRVEALAREAVVRSRNGETYDECCRARALELERRVDRNRMWSRALGVTSAMLVGSGLVLWLSRTETGAISVRHGSYTSLEYRTHF